MRGDDIIPPESGGDEPAEEGRRIPPIIDQDDRSFVMRYLGPLIEAVQIRVRRFWDGLVFWLKRALLVALALAVLVMVAAQFVSPQRSGNILHWQNVTQHLTGLWRDAVGAPSEEAPEEVPEKAPVNGAIDTPLAEAPGDLSESEQPAQEEVEAAPAEVAQVASPPEKSENDLAVPLDDASQSAQSNDTAQAELARERAAHAATRAALLALQVAAPSPPASQQDLVAALLVRLEAGQAYGGALGAIDDMSVIAPQNRALLAAHAQGAPNIASLQKSYAILRAILVAVPDPSRAETSQPAPPAAFAWLKETSRGLVEIKKTPPVPQSGAETETVPVARFDAMMAQGAFSEFHATLGALAPKAPANSAAAWQTLSREIGVYLQLQPMIAALKQTHLSEAGR